MLKTLAFAGTAASIMTLSVVDVAKAVQINLGGTDYNITTTTGTYGDLQTTLESQPWWGSSELAEEGAGDLGASLGFPNGLGPYFAYERTATSTRGWSFDDEDNAAIGIGVFDPGGFSATRTWAITEAVASVPEPASLLGLAAVAGIGLATRRKLAQQQEGA